MPIPAPFRMSAKEDKRPLEGNRPARYGICAIHETAYTSPNGEDGFATFFNEI